MTKKIAINVAFLLWFPLFMAATGVQWVDFEVPCIGIIIAIILVCVPLKDSWSKGIRHPANLYHRLRFLAADAILFFLMTKILKYGHPKWLFFSRRTVNVMEELLGLCVFIFPIVLYFFFTGIIRRRRGAKNRLPIKFYLIYMAFVFFLIIMHCGVPRWKMGQAGMYVFAALGVTINECALRAKTDEDIDAVFRMAGVLFFLIGLASPAINAGLHLLGIFLGSTLLLMYSIKSSFYSEAINTKPDTTQILPDAVFAITITCMLYCLTAINYITISYKIYLLAVGALVLQTYFYFRPDTAEKALRTKVVSGVIFYALFAAYYPHIWKDRFGFLLLPACATLILLRPTSGLEEKKRRMILPVTVALTAGTFAFLYCIDFTYAKIAGFLITTSLLFWANFRNRSFLGKRTANMALFLMIALMYFLATSKEFRESTGFF